MSRYIDANALIERFRHFPPFLVASKFTKDGVVDLIVSQTTANVAPIADNVQKMQDIIATKYAVSKVHYVKDEAPTITYQLTNWQLDQIAKEMLEGAK